MCQIPINCCFTYMDTPIYLQLSSLWQCPLRPSFPIAYKRARQTPLQDKMKEEGYHTRYMLTHIHSPHTLTKAYTKEESPIACYNGKSRTGNRIAFVPKDTARRRARRCQCASRPRTGRTVRDGLAVVSFESFFFSRDISLFLDRLLL